MATGSRRRGSRERKPSGEILLTAWLQVVQCGRHLGALTHEERPSFDSATIGFLKNEEGFVSRQLYSEGFISSYRKKNTHNG